MGDITLLIFQLAIFFLSVIIHEISHGTAANLLGDPTAKDAGRLSFNPLRHLDLWGSLLVPFLLFMASSGSFVFGWAKPVPINPYFFKNPKRDIGLTSFAGPASNFAVAFIFGLLLRLAEHFNFITSPLLLFFTLVIYINLLLGVFNLVPIPPLDGSKILFSLAPKSFLPVMEFLERFGMLLLLIFIFFLFPVLYPIINFLFRLATGMPDLNF